MMSRRRVVFAIRMVASVATPWVGIARSKCSTVVMVTGNRAQNLKRVKGTVKCFELHFQVVGITTVYDDYFPLTACAS